MNQQNPLTLITPIKSDKENVKHLRDILRSMKYTLEDGDHVLANFKEAADVHYLRWLIIDDPDCPFFQGKDIDGPPQLVFSSNFDGTIENHIEDLSRDNLRPLEDERNPGVLDPNKNLIDQIYGCCDGYPDFYNGSTNKLDPEGREKARQSYFHDHSVKAAAFYKGSPKRSVEQILNENLLRERIRELLEEKKVSGKSAKEMHRALRQLVYSDDKFNWAKEKFKMPRRNWFKWLLLVITIIILLPVVLIWLLIVQLKYEPKDKYWETYRSQMDPKLVEELEEYEDLTDGQRIDPMTNKPIPRVINYQNQFSQLVDVKPGWVRLITFKAMMLFASTLIPIKYVKGTLLNIPTIHFARWVLFDTDKPTKRVLFFSNFDGSWQQYLGDFIDQSGWGLSAIFSNTAIFPKTNWLGLTGIGSMHNILPKSKNFFPGGAYDEEHFLAWSRSTELPTAIWYSAYPELSIKNVNNNSRIRVMLNQDLSERKAKKFFELI